MFSEKLRETRKKKGVSQKDVADAIGMSQAAYSHYESGRTMPALDVLMKICKFLNVSTDDLLQYADDNMMMAVNGMDEFQMFCEKMYDICRSINKEGRSRLLQYAHELMELERYKRGYSEQKESVG